jgi:uncharacterized repeat protein (TIGR03803 family)
MIRLLDTGKRMLACCCALMMFVPIAAARAKTETVLYSFQNNGADGNQPDGSLISVGSVLYGATGLGGASNVGTVYSVNPSTGAETVLYSFQNNGADGNEPSAGLLNIDGTLYGTTLEGGNAGGGTVYSFNPATGAETVLYAFQNNGVDGISPHGDLINVNGTLYGTTAFGGEGGGGTVFSINLSTGTESVLHAFSTEDGKGQNPLAGLVNVNGTLYGTTGLGGGFGNGIVFSIDLSSGAYAVLYSFGINGDSNDPQSDLIDVHGTLYGTTVSGGTGHACSGSTSGCGTVFSINPLTGAESVLYSFHKVVTDGSGPIAGVIDVNGTLYGTTELGGASNVGTVFSLNPSTGAESVLYSFKKKGDGRTPDTGLIDFRKALYGTTNQAGAQNEGTVYKVKP